MIIKHVLLVIDVQQASFERPEPIYDAAGLLRRINDLADAVRKNEGQVVFVQFTGAPGTPYDPEKAGWRLVPELEVRPDDVLLRKPGSDAFQGTNLSDVLDPPGRCRVIVTGCDTEFCVDSTVRSALALGHSVTVPEDGHSLTDRPHLTAVQIIAHHNAIWSLAGALAGPVRVCKCSEVFLET